MSDESEWDSSSEEEEASASDAEVNSSSSSSSSDGDSSEEDEAPKPAPAARGPPAAAARGPPAAAAAKEVAQEAEEEDGDVQLTAAQMEERREANVRALVAGSLHVERRALLPKLLTVASAEAFLKLPFKSPHPNAPAASDVSAAVMITLLGGATSFRSRGRRQYLLNVPL